MNPRLAAWGVALALALTYGGARAGAWELAIDDPPEGIRVFVRDTERGYREFRGVMRTPSRLSAFVALFRDIERMPEWVYRIKQARVLERVGPTEVYAYTVTKMDWPLADRDGIVHSMLSQDPATLVVTIRGSARPDFRPLVKRYVRMPVIESHWSFVPLGGGEVEVVFQGYGDPGGNLSSGILKWVAQSLIQEAPYRTLLGMRRLIGAAAYQQASYDFVVEPSR